MFCRHRRFGRSIGSNLKVVPAGLTRDYNFVYSPALAFLNIGGLLSTVITEIGREVSLIKE